MKEPYTGEEVSEQKCNCFTISGITDSLNLLDELCFKELTPENCSCICYNVIRCCNEIINKNLKYNDPVRLSFTDKFYRLRHELLFKSVMLYLGLQQDKSDRPFSDFGIESNRTPDFIQQIDNKLFVIEITATSSFEKGAQQKGLETAGFESKYKKEVGLLTDLGFTVVYVVIIFDTSSIEGREYELGLYELKEILGDPRIKNKSTINYISKELKIITSNIREYLTAPSSILFTNLFRIEANHNDLEFLYNYYRDDDNNKIMDDYQEHKISQKIYMKVINIWNSLYYKVGRLNDDNKYIMVVDIIPNKVYFEKRRMDGLNKIEWFNIIQNNYRKKAFENCFLKIGNEYKPSTDSETGYTYTTKSDLDEINSPDFSNLELTISSKGHDPEPYINLEQQDLTKYNLLSENCKNSNLKPVYYDKNFENNYFKFISKLDNYCISEKRGVKSYNYNEYPTFLGENKIKDMNVEDMMSGMVKKFKEVNNFDDSFPLKIKRMKAPFILPMAHINQTNYTSYKFKNESFLNGCKEALSGSNQFTSLILQKCLESDYRFGDDESRQPSEFLLSKINEKSKLSRQATLLYKQAIKHVNKGLSNKVISVKVESIDNDGIKMEYKDLQSKISKVSKEIESQYNVERIKRNIGMIRLKTKRIKKTKEKPHINENYLTSLFKEEMKHFKDRTVQSTIEGVGLNIGIKEDYDNHKTKIDNLIEMFKLNCGVNPDKIVDLESYKDCGLLKECKDYSINRYKNIVNEIANSFLGHSSALVSRMAHSLLFYSQLPFSSDYIRVDNLGYKDVLMIVKGGKKIFKTKSSKLFRLIYPINETIHSLYFDSKLEQNSFNWFNYKDKIYMVTPWSLMHESILNDALSFYPRVTSFVILNSNPEMSYSKQVRKTAINVILAFHNRRQTEELLANLRYILLSTIGEYSAFQGILSDFVGFNYDIFQAYIRCSIVLNYPNYFLEMTTSDIIKKKNKGEINCHNIFTGDKIKNPDDLALMIYSTFLMTKAPYQRSIERSNNLLGILKIHKEFEIEIGLNLTPKEQFDKICVDVNDTDLLYVDKLFKNDFTIDPYLITQIGIFADSYYKNRNLEEKIFVIWNRILNENWDSMATSTGLRGRLDDVQTFWGKKGYFVVYKEITSSKEYMDKVNELFLSNEDDDSKRKKLRKLNQTFLDKISKPAECLIYHAVDKTQWRGGREIYVMDIDTKGEQQPIEKFMGELCKLLDNELISIPSDKRAQTIHHSIFEKDLPLKDALTYYMTLDCSKWAPKSMFIKFCLMIIPMNTIPLSFKIHFMNYLNKLYYKRIYFNNSEVEILSNNPKYKDLISKYLIKDKKVDGYYMIMPYSWVMGIFNYTSSFLHAFNQKYMSYVIQETSINNFNSETTLIMFAHSDDSGGRISSSEEFLIQRGVIIYEIGLKGCNHLLSRKKCTVSLVYFEILSVIYLYKKLLALLPKFLGGLRFLPTDKGMAQDMLQSYSKSIEIMVSGGDFSVSYLVMKIHSYLTWRFYMNSQPVPSDYERPVQYIGMPDAHPLIVLLSGSDSDIVRITYTMGESYMAKMLSMVKNTFENYDEEGSIRSLKFKIQIRNSVKGFENVSEIFRPLLNNWVVKNVNFKNTPFALLNFLSKLNDPGFVGSLLNESPIRRVSRSYYLRSGETVMTAYGSKDLKWTYNVLQLIQVYSRGDDNSDFIIFKELLGESETLNLKNQVENLVEMNKGNISLYKVSLHNIFKIYKYFEQITIKGKTFLETNRTLKPTHLEIVKTSKPFSVQFNVNQLVAYCKHPEFKWALPDVGNLMTAELELNKLLNIHDIKIEEIDEGSLMKLLNQFTGKTVKDIYMYSHIPSEIRTMRTYSSLLSFLSVNTQKGKEISGLVLKLQSDLTDPGYLPLQIEENIYLYNTFLSTVNVLVKLLGWSFVSNLKIRDCELLNIKGGGLLDVISQIEKNSRENFHFAYLSPMINYIKSKMEWPNRQPTGEIFKNGAYYTFTKSQKSGTGWYGKGEIIVVIGSLFFKIQLLNNSVTSVYTNCEGKLDKVTFDYLIDTLTSNDIYINSRDFKDPIKVKTEMGIGFDQSGDLKISNKRELVKCIECYYVSSLSGDLSHLSYFYVEEQDETNFRLKRRGETENTVGLKIRTIKILKGEILNTMRLFFDPSDFQQQIDESGIETYEEFLLTEVLTNYVGEKYIDFNIFVDNFQSSELYKVMNWSSINQEDLTSVNLFGILPGTKGGFLKMFIDYGIETKNWIVKPPNRVNRALMDIRSEYPENFTAILQDKLNEFYVDLYSPEENQEIRKSYIKLVTGDSTEEVRSELIKLMCYWGYSSLVNTISVFKNLQVTKNYELFKVTGFNPKDQMLYSNLFCVLLKNINDCIREFRSVFRNIETKKPRLTEGVKGGVDQIIVNNVKCLVNSIYGYNIQLTNTELPRLRFLNLLDGLLELPEFTEMLTKKLSNHYPLSMLPIDQENKLNLIVCYNTLNIIWSKQQKNDYKLDYTKSVERFPNNSIPAPTSLYKLFTDIISPSAVYFHGMLNREYVSYINKDMHYEYKGKTYKISNRIKSPSDIEVDLNEVIEMPYPLNEETLENELWDEIQMELSMGDIDVETILEFWGEIENKFCDPQTKIIGNEIQVAINWILFFNKEGTLPPLKYLRQVGDLVVLLSTSYQPKIEGLKNIQTRYITCKTESKFDSEFFAYILAPPEIDEEFINKFISKNKIIPLLNSDEDLNYHTIRSPEGVVDCRYSGVYFGAEITEGMTFGDLPVEDENLQQNFSENLIDNQIKSMQEVIKESIENNPNMKEVYENIFNKYKEQLRAGFNLNLEQIMESMIAELDLNDLKNLIDSGTSELTKSEVTNIFISPTVFGMAGGGSKTKRPVNYKNKSIKAELESINQDLADKIASGSLTVSKTYQDLLESNLKLWALYSEKTKHKQEQKKFLWNVIRTVCIDSTKVTDDDDDYLWDDVIKKITKYITEEPEEKKDILGRFPLKLQQGSRLKYRHKGS